MSDHAGDVEIILRANTASYSQSLDKVMKQHRQLNQTAGELGHASVTSVQAASGAIRLLEGDITRNVRAVEKFITTIPGVGKALQAAFPIVGALAFAGVVARVGKELVDFIQTANRVPKELQQGFQALSLSQQSANDALAVTNDKLRIEIAQLEHKPVNYAALAIDETRVAADKLAQSLQTDMERLDGLLKSKQISLLGAFLTGKTGTANVTGSVTSYEEKLSDLGYQYAQAVRQGNQTLAGSLKSQIDATRVSAHNYAQGQIATRRASQKNPGAYNESANLAILEGFDRSIGDSQTGEQLEEQNKSLEARKTIDDAKKKQAQQAAEAARKQQEEIIKNWQSQLDSLKAIEDVTIEREFSFWAQRITASKAGSASYIEAVNNANKQIGRIREENIRGGNEYDKTAGGPVPQSDLSKTDEGYLRDQGRGSNEYLKYLNAGVAIQRQNADAMAEASLQMETATGRMSSYDAAVALAALHTQQYQEQLQYLQAALQSIANDPTLSAIDRAAQSAGIGNQISQLNGQRSIQSQQDDASIEAASSLGALRLSADQLTASFLDSSAKTRELLDSAFGGVNDQIVNALSGRHTNFGNTGADIFRGVANLGLQKAEGSVLSMLGLGPKSGQRQPVTAWIENWPGMGASSSGSAISDLLTSNEKGGSGISSLIPQALAFLPGFASGGPVAANMPIMVGEKGPEPFIPKTSGTIIPHDAIGGVTNHVYIDASGSSDPDAVEASVHRAMGQYMPYSVSGAVAAVSERQKRIPLTQR